MSQETQIGNLSGGISDEDSKLVDSILNDLNSHSEQEGLPLVVLDSDAEPFVRDGRNVMHGFIVGQKGLLKSGMPCLIINEVGDLLAHGISQCGPRELLSFCKGIAVKVRGGVTLIEDTGQ